jgi:hypothetical protein
VAAANDRIEIRRLSALFFITNLCQHFSYSREKSASFKFEIMMEFNSLATKKKHH